MIRFEEITTKNVWDVMYDDGLLIGFVMLGYGKTGHEDDPEIAENNYCLCLTLN